MQTFKIRHFERDHPGCSFPWFQSLSPAEAQDLRARLAGRVGLPSTVDLLELVERLDELADEIPCTNPEQGPLDVSAVLHAQGIRPLSEVYVNWHRYDDIDRMRLADLARNFDDVWYPSSDDLDILDETLTWILSVSHEGTVKLARLSPS